MNHILSRIVLCGFLSIFSLSVNSAWNRTSIGGGGAFTSVAVCNNDVILAGSDLSGAYISKDNGYNWQVKGAISGLEITHAQSVACSLDSSNILLVGGENGIFRSSDDGNTFTRVLDSSFGYIKSIAFAASNNSNRVYAIAKSSGTATDSELLVSNDRGLTFTSEGVIDSSNAVSISKIVINPIDEDKILLLSGKDRFTPDSTSKSVYMSNDGGNTFSEIATQYNNIVDVVFHPSHPTMTFISDEYEGIFVNDNSLTSDIWVPVATSIEFRSTYDGITIWPIVDSNSIKIRLIDSYISYWNYGIPSSWSGEYDTQTHPEYANVRPSAWEATLDQNTSTWSATPVSSVRDWTGDSTNWKQGWSLQASIFNGPYSGLNKALGYHLNKQRPDTAFFVTNQFIFKGTYTHTASNPVKLDFEPVFSRAVNNTWRSRGIDNVTATLVDVNDYDSNVIYAGMEDVGCIVSKNKGISWDNCNHTFSGQEQWVGIDGVAYGGSVYALLSDPLDASVVWSAASQGQNNIANVTGQVHLLRSNDYGASWSESTGLPLSADIYGLSVDKSSPYANRKLYVTANGQLYRSQDNGSTWQLANSCDINADTVSGCRVTNVTESGVLIVGGEEGIFYSDDDGTTLNEFSSIFSGGFPIGYDGAGNELRFHVNGWKGVVSITEDNNESIYLAVFQSGSNNGNSDNKGGIYKCDLTTTNCSQIFGNPSINQKASFIRDVFLDENSKIYALSSSAFTSGRYHSESAGVSVSSDSGLTWTQDNDGLGWPFAFKMDSSPDDTSTVFLASPGAGIYSKNIETTKVADYREDFSATSPVDWSYQTNTLSGLSNPTSNVPLDSDNYVYYTPTAGDYGRLSNIGGHTGLGLDESSTDNYVIAGYTVPVTGTYFLKDGYVEFPSQYSTGGNLKIYTHSAPTPIADVDISDESTHIIDLELGQMSAGDKIYVAVGPDGSDGADSFLMDYSIEYKNYPPEITNPGQQTSFINVSDSVQITASDPENDSLTYSAINLPVGMSINTSTGEITGVPTTLGTVYPTVTVSDANNTRSASFIWNISEASSSGTANYHDDFSSNNPNGQWRYLWNENGSIDDSNNYSPLDWHSWRYTKFKADNSGPVDAMEFGQLTSTGGHPGRGTSDGEQDDRFVIVAYDIDQAGFYEIVDSAFDAGLASWEINNSNQGQEIRIYVNNTLKQSIQRVDVNNFDFDMSLGMLSANDTVYVAFGPKGSQGSDGFSFDFSIQQTSLTTAASFQSDYQTSTPASQWIYQWSNDGNVDNVSNWAPLYYRGNWAYFRNTTDGYPSQSAFRYGMLNATGGHTPGASGQTYPNGSGSITNDQYVIATYTTDSSGDYHLINSEITFGSSGSDGGDVRVYVDSQLVYSTNVTQQNLTSFDVDLGTLSAGQNISVAVGPGDSDGSDGFTMDFDIAK